MGHPCAVKSDRRWERLTEYINEWASAREVPGGIEVTFEQSPGVTRTVDVVLTLSDWDDYARTIFGTDDPRATTLKKSVLAMPDGAHYLVYDTYDWAASETPQLPEDDVAPGPGAWVVTDPDGHVIDRFADVDDRD